MVRCIISDYLYLGFKRSLLVQEIFILLWFIEYMEFGTVKGVFQ